MNYLYFFEVKPLSEMHTKQLLKLIKYARKFGGTVTIGQASNSKTYSVFCLRQELSKREHVPDKVEAKKIRQKQARANKNR